MISIVFLSLLSRSIEVAFSEMMNWMIQSVIGFFEIEESWEGIIFDCGIYLVETGLEDHWFIKLFLCVFSVQKNENMIFKKITSTSPNIVKAATYRDLNIPPEQLFWLIICHAIGKFESVLNRSNFRKFSSWFKKLRHKRATKSMKRSVIELEIGYSTAVWLGYYCR